MMSVYNLESVDLPAVKGRALRLLAMAMERPPLRYFLIRQFMQAGGVPKLRDRGIQEVPAFLPTVEPVRRPAPAPSRDLSFDPDSARPDVPFRTVWDFAEAYRSRASHPLEVAERIVELLRTDIHDSRPLRAIVTWDETDLLTQARESAVRIEQGRPRSVLEGVPVAIKDEIDQVPFPTRVGTRLFGGQPASRDATVVQRLREAGALLIGKANMHEIGIHPNGHNLHYGMARNPYNREFDTGGSSSGSAAAVAGGLCPLSLGADGGGSIRVPAALCGVVGLKATFGRISECGAAPVCWSLAHLGPLGTSVQDVSLAYSIIAGPDPRDPISLRQPPLDRGWNDAGLSGLRVGSFPAWFGHADARIVEACEAALQQLVQAGATWYPVEVPELDEMRVAHAITILSEMAASMESLGFPRNKFAPSTRVNLSIGRAFSSADYVNAQRMRTRALRIFGELFQKVDLLVTPATAIIAPRIPEPALSTGWSNPRETTELMRFTFPANLAGMPAMSVPVGYTAEGLPMGMQLMAAHWREDLLFRAGLVLQNTIPRRPPGGYADLLAGDGS
jgi:Asp-tRNA(Asn)/Glu-tRNA(Gln) amidotransferase A subunit family amidase